MEKQQLINTLESNFEKYLRFLCDICSFEARAKDKETINRMMDYIADFAHAEGFQTVRTPMENCGDFLCVEMNAGAEKGCAFLAHTDTVHEKGVFGPNPVTRTEDRIIAPRCHRLQGRHCHCHAGDESIAGKRLSEASAAAADFR